jgi:hypothetical protein
VIVVDPELGVGVAASVTVKVYVPAVLENVPVPVYGVVPPVAVTVTVVVPPKHAMVVGLALAVTTIPDIVPFAKSTVPS